LAFLQPLAAFSGLTPESLVNGLQVKALQDYLDGVSDGGFA
jgi:hypothetical protein